MGDTFIYKGSNIVLANLRNNVFILTLGTVLGKFLQYEEKKLLFD